MSRRILLLLLSISMIAAFVRLGLWQVDRAHYKERLLAHSRQVVSDRKPDVLYAAADAPDQVNEADAYEWTAGSGHFLSLPPIRLDNQIRNGVAGIRVYRVFQPDGAQHAILVELGWRPLPSHLDIPPEPAPPDLTQVRGLLAPPPVGGLKLGPERIVPQKDGSLLLMRITPDKIAAALKLKNGLAPRVLILDTGMKVGYKRDLQVLSGALPPAAHRAYAVQWFGMAIALGVITIVMVRRYWREARKPEGDQG
ncbi:MAG: SURF1 family protein [Proteobacteria bacterium]|nr:SURF1 family protein [Pseudomonadota bacterium]